MSSLQKTGTAAKCALYQLISLESIFRADASAAPSTTQLLKARQYYIRQLDAANSDNSSVSLFRHRISITFCLALLENLVSGAAAASIAMTQQITYLRAESNQSAEEEEALALHAKILFRNTQTRSAFRPGHLRALLEEALQRFPNNSIFLSLYLFNEIRTRIAGRVKRLLDEKILPDNVVTTNGWLFAVYAELHLDARRYSAEAIRALFERAVINPR